MAARRQMLAGLLGTVLIVCGVAAVPLVGSASQKISYEWSIDLVCAKCHATQAATLLVEDESAQAKEAPEGKELVDSYVSLHAGQFGFDCASCHEDDEGLAAGHKKLNSGKEATRLRKSSVSSDLCRSCHADADLVKTTKGSVVLTDRNGTTVNPHDLPAGEGHDDLACVDCHKAHEEGMTVAESARTACESCRHAGVFECGTCH